MLLYLFNHNLKANNCELISTAGQKTNWRKLNKKTANKRAAGKQKTAKKYNKKSSKKRKKYNNKNSSWPAKKMVKSSWPAVPAMVSASARVLIEWQCTMETPEHIFSPKIKGNWSPEYFLPKFSTKWKRCNYSYKVGKILNILSSIENVSYSSLQLNENNKYIRIYLCKTCSQASELR